MPELGEDMGVFWWFHHQNTPIYPLYHGDSQRLIHFIRENSCKCLLLWFSEQLYQNLSKKGEMCSGQRKLEQLANPVISQRSGEIPVTRLGPSPAQTVFHAWFQGFFTLFRMTNVQTTLDQYKKR